MAYPSRACCIRLVNFFFTSVIESNTIDHLVHFSLLILIRIIVLCMLLISPRLRLSVTLSLGDYDKKQFVIANNNDKSMSGLLWSTALLKHVGVSQEMQYDDAFTLQQVEPELVEIFNFMAGMVPFIQKLIKDVGKHVFISILCARILTRCTRLSRTCDYNPDCKPSF